MLYTMLIYAAEETLENFSSEDRERCLVGHRELQQKTKENGAFQAAVELMSTTSATTLRVRDGKSSVVDGPFAETKEHLVGLYIFDCEDLDQALAHAQGIPHAGAGSIEIRPIAHFEAAAAD
ncbi:MAG: YciI family protein [Alphaproteobacteria bacterium]